jgi:hypothetical protein
MTRWLSAAVASLVCFAATAAPPSAPVEKLRAFDGKVLPLAKVLEKQGAKPDPDTAGVALVTADGTVYTLVKDDASRLLFLDPQLHDRPVCLTARRLPGAQVLKVEKVQAVKDGKPFDLDYWCENCQLSYPQPGKCHCCQGETVLRELPAK